MKNFITFPKSGKIKLFCGLWWRSHSWETLISVLPDHLAKDQFFQPLMAGLADLQLPGNEWPSPYIVYTSLHRVRTAGICVGRLKTWSIDVWRQCHQCCPLGGRNGAREFQFSSVSQDSGGGTKWKGSWEKWFSIGNPDRVPEEMFNKYGSNLICIDATHGTTAYYFQLITVLTIDDFNEGIPVAWMISNKELTDSVRVFFQSLRERCGDVTTKFFSSAFSRPDRKLLCNWHMDRR